MMRTLTSAQQGFTLMEVLIALMLMAMLSLISWRALDSVVSTSERLGANADQLNAMVRVMGQLQYDVSQYANRDILPLRPTLPVEGTNTPNTGSSDTGAAGTETGVLPPGIRVVPQDQPSPLLAVVRAASAGDGSWQNVYWYQDGSNLRRTVGLPSRQLPLPEPDPAGDVVLTNVERFAVRAWLPGRGWTALPAPEGSPAATGLEVTIQRQQDGKLVPYRKVILLP